LETLGAPLFAAKDNLPCVKLVSFTDRSKPFCIMASYANPESLPAGTNPHIGRYVIDGFPEEIKDPHPKIKVEFNINLHGMFTVVKAVLMQLKPEEEPAPAAMETDETPKPDKMDTTEDDAAKTEPEPKPKKKKYNRTALKFKATTTGLTQKQRQLYYETESGMSNQDRVIAETSLAREMLERYVLEMRGRIDSSMDLGNFITDAEKAVFSEKLDSEDDWLMTDEGYDSQKSEYKKRLNALMTYGTPVTKRHYEHKERPKAVETVKNMVGHYIGFATSTDEAYAHITKEQRDTVLKKCEEIDNWLGAAVQQQAALPLNANPSLTKSMLIEKAKELDGVCKPIKKTPKPAPPAPEKTEEKPEEKKEEEAPEPMETN